jgi:hypothetical protein
MLLKLRLCGIRRAISVHPASVRPGTGCNWRRVSISAYLGTKRMSSLFVPRRRFLRGLASLAVCAPPVVRASSLMPISARYCPSAHAAPPWATPQDALALLQHELERRFAESLFGAEGLSPEAENGASPRSPIVAEAKITALWQLRTWFGPRGSPPKPFEELPAEVRAGLLSILEPSSGGLGSESWKAGFASFAAGERVLRSI